MAIGLSAFDLGLSVGTFIFCVWIIVRVVRYHKGYYGYIEKGVPVQSEFESDDHILSVLYFYNVYASRLFGSKIILHSGSHGHLGQFFDYVRYHLFAKGYLTVWRGHVGLSVEAHVGPGQILVPMDRYFMDYYFHNGYSKDSEKEIKVYKSAQPHDLMLQSIMTGHFLDQGYLEEGKSWREKKYKLTEKGKDILRKLMGYKQYLEKVESERLDQAFDKNEQIDSQQQELVIMMLGLRVDTRWAKLVRQGKVKDGVNIIGWF